MENTLGPVGNLVYSSVPCSAPAQGDSDPKSSLSCKGKRTQPGGTEQFFILEKTELFPHFCLVLLGLCELNLAQVFHLEKEDNDPDLSRGAHSRTGRAAQSSIWVL